MAVKTYNSKSYELAEHFMQDDERSRNDPDLRKRSTHELALAIQAAVEDWFFEEREEFR